jgi:outer membrane protein TolC
MPTLRRSRRFLLPLTALFVLAPCIGCAVDQQKEVAQYQKVLRANLLANEREFAAAPGTRLTLRQALDLANRQNERLAIEGENYLQALIDRKRAAAAFLPTVSLVPTYSFRETVNAGGGSASDASPNDRTFNVPASGHANLFGFSDVARLRGSARTIEQRRNLLLDLQESVLLDVAQVYYQVLRSERSADVLASSLKVQEARVRDIQGRQAAGVARPLDVAQTEAQASATRVALINARNDVRNGRATLAFLTAAPVQESELLDAYEPPAALPPLTEMQALAANRRRDLRAARAAVLAARQGVEAAFGQYYPSVTLDVNVFVYRESFPDDRMWDGLLRANLPIFSAGVIRADVREAWSFYRQAALAESLLRRDVAQQVQLASQDMQANEDRIAELQVQLRAARQAFNQADQSYNVGLATNLERVTSQDQLLSAQLQLTSAQFDRTLSYLALARATGELRHRLETTPSAAATQPTTQTAGEIRMTKPETRIKSE